MAVTSTQSKNPASVSQVAIGAYLDTGTAAAIKITIGFRPRYVLVLNENDRDGYEWFEGMADAEAFKTVAAGTRTMITTLGITPADDGFTIGLDLDVNVQNQQLSWMAIQ